jgi:AraC-like DNA-binding protein
MIISCDRIREWRDQVARHALNIDFEPLSDAPFRAAVKPLFEGCIRICHSPGATFRDEELVRDGRDHFALLLSESNSLDVVHRHRDLRLGRGDGTLMHVSETGSIGSRGDVQYLAVNLSDLRSHDPLVAEAVMHRLPRQSEAMRLIRCYLRSVERNRLGTSAELCEAIRRHVIDLLAIAVSRHGSIGESSSSGVMAVRLHALLDNIAARFQDPGLTVAAVALQQGISPRYVQRLLETAGISFTSHINELRLQRAFALLAEPRESRRSVIDIALEVGFSDISHFNRLFRARFGDTPSGVRGTAVAASP